MSLYARLNVLTAAHRIDVSRRRAQLRNARMALPLDENFSLHYRLTRPQFESLVEELTPLLRTGRTRSSLSPRCKILVALSFYATGSYQRLVGTSRGTTMCQQTVSRCLREVTNALNNHAIMRRHIAFPANLQERNAVKKQFFQKYKIPGVVGCIDGTHVAIIRPSEDEERFFNRKHFHSMNVQIICDSNLNILSVDASWGGASHDSHVFNNHPVKEHLIELTNQGEQVRLLGDSGYALREYMLTPIVNAPEGSPEEFFTKRHCQARNPVERTIGVLKGRWRCLLQHRVLHYTPDMAAKIVNACCVLHNICNRARLPVPADMPDVEEPSVGLEPPQPLEQESLPLQRGQSARSRIVTLLWNTRS